MKHCGKSTLGKRLADDYGQPFFDMDDLTAKHVSERDGVTETARETFGRLGAEGFESTEAETVLSFMERTRSHDKGFVLALGGRTPLNDRAIPFLRQLGICVFLEVEPELLWERVERNGVPPFLDPHRPREDFMELHGRRAVGYRAVADHVVTLDGRASVEENVRRLHTALEE